jgi:hypothetical protein
VIERAWQDHSFVTLTGTSLTKTSFAIPGFRSEEYSAARAYFAHDALSSATFNIRRCSIRLEHLDAWAKAGSHGWTERLAFEAPLHLTYNKPEPLSAAIDERFALKLDYSLRSSIGRRGLLASERASFVGEWTDPVDVEIGIRSVVVPLTQLVALLTDGPGRVLDVSVLPEATDSSVVRVVAPWTMNRASRVLRRFKPEHGFLFTLDDVANNFDELLTQWYSFRSTHLGFFGAFFGFIAAPPAFAEQKFLLMMHVARLLCRSSAQSITGAPMDTVTGADAVGWILRHLDPNRIGAALAPLPANFLDGVRAVETQVNSGETVPGVTLIWHTETVKWLAKAYVLHQLPVFRDRAGDILARNEEMRFTLGRLGGQG